MKIFIFLLTLLASAVFEIVAEPSPGCGKAPTKLRSGTNTLNINGLSRRFILQLPDNYNNKNPYRLIFTFHATGGTANDTAKSYYGLRSRAGSSTIFVSPQGQALGSINGKATGPFGSLLSITGWWQTGGNYGEQDLEFVDRIITAIDADFCINTKLRFSTGFSFGGVMSHSLACLRPDKFRAVSVQSGAEFDAVITGMSTNNKGKGVGSKGSTTKPPGACKKTDGFSAAYMGFDPSAMISGLLLGGKPPGPKFACGKTPVTYMGYMGACDGWIQYGRRARDDFVRINGCKAEEAKPPVEGSGKRVQTAYKCPSETPVVWTEFDGGHQPIRDAEEGTWKFFSRFK